MPPISVTIASDERLVRSLPRRLRSRVSPHEVSRRRESFEVLGFEGRVVVCSLEQVVRVRPSVALDGLS